MADALRSIVDEALTALGQLVDAAQDEQSLLGLLGELGWTPNSIPRPFSEIAEIGSDLLDLLGSDAANIPTEQVLTAVGRLVGLINQMSSRPDSDFPTGIDLDAFKQTVGRDLFDYLLVEYLLRYRYSIGSMLKLAGLIRLVKTPANGLRKAYIKRYVSWSDFAEIVSNPLKGFQDASEWGSATPLLAQTLSDLGGLFESNGLRYSAFQVTGDQLTFLNTGAVQPVGDSFGVDGASSPGRSPLLY